MKIKIELGNDEVKEMLKERVRAIMPDIDMEDSKIFITVRSKQNFRNHEWEDGEIKVEYEK
jgi:hypothetical protein